MAERVLIVDDERTNRTLLRAYLASSGLQVLEADRADVALERARLEAVDLVLLDVLMPGMNGFEACRALKAGSREYLPVILLTGLSEQEDRNAGLEAGADDFLSKPVDRRELILRVQAFLRIRRQERQIREQEQELRRQLIETAQLHALKEELFALIVHDIRNPLTGAAGFLELLRDALVARSDPLADQAAQALRSTDRIEELLRTVLEVQMLESGVVPLQRSRGPLRPLVEEAIQSLAGAARATDIAIDLQPGDDLEVEVDRHLIRRSIENLLANAIKYSPRRGRIEVSVDGDERGVELAVGDQGPGIPDTLKSVLFQKFGSVEAKTGSIRRGHGLGLHLVKLVASAHHGSVDARDRPAGGTTFVISLRAS